MSPGMALVIHRALVREQATGNEARVIGPEQTIEALRRRGWVNEVLRQDKRAVGELTQAGRDAYRAHRDRHTYPLTDKALAGLRLVATPRQDRTAGGRHGVQQLLSPRVFGGLRGRRLIEWDHGAQDYVLTEAGRVSLAEAEGTGPA